MQRLSIPVLLPVVLLTFSQCKKDKDRNSSSSSIEPVKTSVGSPVGDAQTFTVTASGGSFAWQDSSIVVTVPAGAVSTSTDIKVQQVENTCTAGIGKSFSLTPHGTVFQKPVSLQFSYAGQTEANIPKALGVSYQDKDGTWRLVNGANVDTIHKTITIKTTHFSNWSQIEWFKLEPANATLNPGESIALKVISYIDFDQKEPLTPLIKPGEAEAGLGEAHEVPSSFIKKWYVGGAGSVQPNGAKCTYTAPASVNDVTTVAVVAELAAGQSEQWLLISNIIVMNEGVTFRVNGGSWIHFPASVSYLDDYQTSLANTRQDSAFSIIWPGGAGAFGWTSDLSLSSETVVGFTIPAAGIHYQSNWMDEQGVFHESGGSVKIDVLGNVGSYVTGSFTASPCAIIGFNTGKIKGLTSMTGYFRVKRMR